MTFKVIDKKTGGEPTDRVITNIAKSSGLMEMDIDQFAVCEDGQIILLDDCGNAAYLDMERFEVELVDELDFCQPHKKIGVNLVVERIIKGPYER